MNRPVEIFFSYAHEDEELMNDVRRQLVVEERNGRILKWHDRMIPPGSDWKERIDRRLDRAGIVLLFMSPHFIESQYCYEVEGQAALRRHERGLARVVPIILRPCLWDRTPFAALQALPMDARPVSTWPNRDEACLDVAKGVMSIVDDVLALSSIGGRNPSGQIGRGAEVLKSLSDQELDLVFVEVMRQQLGLRRSLGEIRSVSSGNLVRIQHFERGFMLWHLSTADRIVIAFDDGHAWHQWHDIAPPPGTSVVRAEGPVAGSPFFKATGGFLRCWLANSLAEKIGFPQELERDLEPPVFFEFENGAMLRNLPWWDRTDRVYGDVPPGLARILVLMGRESGTWQIPSVRLGAATSSA